MIKYGHIFLLLLSYMMDFHSYLKTEFFESNYFHPSCNHRTSELERHRTPLIYKPGFSEMRKLRHRPNLERQVLVCSSHENGLGQTCECLLCPGEEKGQVCLPFPEKCALIGESVCT